MMYKYEIKILAFAIGLLLLTCVAVYIKFVFACIFLVTTSVMNLFGFAIYTALRNSNRQPAEY